MDKERWNIWDLMVAVLLALIVVAEVGLALKIHQVDEESAEVAEIMAEAQERIDAYYASMPARERPAAAASETPRPEASEPAEDWHIPALPLDKQLQKAVFDAACENGVDYFLALGLIKVESNFEADAVSSCGCYGLTQIHPAWFPSGLSPEENVRAGLEHLGGLIGQYKGDVPAALRAYNRGFDDGDRAYSNAVMNAAEEIMSAAGVVTK